MAGAHRAAALGSLLDCPPWLGAAGAPDAYLDEFVFRFNRRTSASRGMLFYRRQAAVTAPVTYSDVIRPLSKPTDTA